MKIDLLGVKINKESRQGILEIINDKLEREKPIFIVTPYSESIVAAQKDDAFRNVLNAADFALPDGIGILWAAKYLKIKNQKSKIKDFFILIKSLSSIIFYPSYIRDPIPEKISGSEFVWDLTGLAQSRGLSVFLLGGYGDTPVLAAKNLKSQIPNLKISGTHAPDYSNCHCEEFATKQSQHPGDCFSAQGRLAMTEMVNSSRADFLFVALGPIRQEKWIFENLPNLRVKLAIGLGGTLDYLARKRPYRPKIWALRGLEWLFRLLTQPWRAMRIFRGVLGLVWYSFRTKSKR